jgi:hypothetical protein
MNGWRSSCLMRVNRVSWCRASFEGRRTFSPCARRCESASFGYSYAYGCGVDGSALVCLQGALEAVFDSSGAPASTLASSRIHGIEGGTTAPVPAAIPPPLPSTGSAASKYPAAYAGSPSLQSSLSASDQLHQPPISTGTMQGFGYDPDAEKKAKGLGASIKGWFGGSGNAATSTSSGGAPVPGRPAPLGGSSVPYGLTSNRDSFAAAPAPYGGV